MGKDIKTKFGFQFENNFHSILGCSENLKGELVIFPSFAQKFSEKEFVNLNNDKQIRNQHYTIHNSPHLDSENVLNHTLEFVDETKLNTRIYTKAFKRTNSLIPIFLARGQDFSNSRYQTFKNPINNYITLGEYDPKITTLYYMVVIGNAEFIFDENYHDINIITINFKKYSMSLLWNFAHIPSHSTGSKSHFLTLPNYHTQIKEGFSKTEIINIYRLNQVFNHHRFLEFCKDEYELKEEDFKIIKRLGFTKTLNSPNVNNRKNIESINKAYEFFIVAQNEKNTGNIKNALKLLNQSAFIFKELGEDLAYADVLNLEGILYQMNGSPELAIKCHSESLEIYKKLNLGFHVAQSYLNISIVHRDSAELDKAIEMANHALNLSSKHGFITLLADANRELGILFKNKNEIDVALEFLTLARNQYHNVYNLEGEAFCMGNMGLIKAQQGNYLDSIKFHTQAMNVFISIEHSQGVSNELANVGNMNCMLNNPKLGLIQLNSALEGHKNIGYKFGIAVDLRLIGACLCNNGELKKGIIHFIESQDLFLKIGNQQEANNVSQILKYLNTF